MSDDPHSELHAPRSSALRNPKSEIRDPKSLRVLVLEDRPADAELMVVELRRQGFDPDWKRVETEPDFVAALDEKLDVILSDFNLPAFDALQAMAHVRRRALTVPVIVVTGAVGEETAAQCIREGAADYLRKDRLARLGLAVSQAIDRRRLADQQQQIESALLASQTELATVFDSAPVAMVILDRERRVVRANRAASRLAGRPPADVFGRLPGDALGCLSAVADPTGCRDDATCQECPLRIVVSETLERRVERHSVECTLPLVGRDGVQEATFLVSSSPIETPTGVLAVVSLEDISERQRGRDRERRLTRLLATIRDINQLIVRETSRDVILAESCRIIVENAGFELAWVGEADHETGLVRRVAVAGDPAMSEALDRVAIRWDDDGPDAGPIAPAIRDRRSVVVDDAETDPRVARWRSMLREVGLRSGISLPLIVTGHAFGALTVYGRHRGEFDHEIVDLLNELADDLGFALGALEVSHQREQAEQSLAASEERYRSLFEQAPIGIYRTTATGRVIAANPALVRMLGYDSFEELAAIDVTQSGFASPEGRQAFREAIGPGGEVVGHQSEWRTRDGDSVFVRENARAIRGADGSVLFYEGTVEDITETHRARRERDLLYDLAVDMFCISGFDGRLRQLNPAWQSNLGWSLDELRSRSFLSFIHPDDREMALAAYAELGAGRTVLANENRVRCRDGSYRWLSWNAHPLPDEGLIVAVAHDTTKRRELEEQLRQSQKMEAVGRLAGGVAHDFNNLLQALLSQTQLVRAHQDDADHLRAITGEIEQQVRRGAALTRQLLLFFRRETTQLAGLDLNRVIRDQVSLLRRLIRANISLNLELAPEGLPITADHGQLEQVLMNLVVNASDALPAGGEITMRSGRKNGTVWFSVEDNGPGIPVELRTKIFEPFFTTKAAVEGTGLGLSVVHGIVTLHGADIAVDDRPGGGTVFTISFPEATTPERGAAEQQAPATPALIRGRGERVLVVEDEAPTREALTDLLEALGYEVVAAGSAEEVVSLPDSPPFEVLLTDMMLPGASGPELAAAARRRWPELKVLLMSGYNENEIVRRGVDAGTVRFLQKPFDMRTLAAELRAALDEDVGDLRG